MGAEHSRIRVAGNDQPDADGLGELSEWCVESGHGAGCTAHEILPAAQTVGVTAGRWDFSRTDVFSIRSDADWSAVEGRPPVPGGSTVTSLI